MAEIKVGRDVRTGAKGKICSLPPSFIDDIKDPHAQRYVHALKLFVTELVQLVNKWQLSIVDIDGAPKLTISLPEGVDGGIYLSWKPAYEKEAMKLGKEQPLKVPDADPDSV